jgi:hypothetical protein
MAKRARRLEADETGAGPEEPRGRFGGARDGYTIHWNGLDARAWDTALGRAERPVLEQSWAYGDALARVSPYLPTRAAIHRDDTLVALVQAHVWRPMLVLSVAKVIRGPVFLEPVDALGRAAVLDLVRRRFPIPKLNLFLFAPDLPDTPESHATMRAIGMRRMVTGYSSIEIDLGPCEEDLRKGLEGNWRNQLTQAEKASLRVKSSHGGAALEWLLERHDRHRRERRLRLPAGDFVRALVDAGRDRRAATVFTAEDGSETVAGVLFLRHGRMATYYVGWSGEKGRDTHAHNLLLWRGLLEMKAAGVERVDLGGVDGLSMPGVSRFKLGLGAPPFTLTGTYL